MLWFKHLKDARNDPFVWDLRQRFGPVGYFVYFATLEIYADNFKAAPGWYLDISIDSGRTSTGRKIGRCWPTASKARQPRSGLRN
jgi:hypothetical protein